MMGDEQALLRLQVGCRPGAEARKGWTHLRGLECGSSANVQALSSVVCSKPPPAPVLLGLARSRRLAPALLQGITLVLKWSGRGTILACELANPQPSLSMSLMIR